MRSDHATPVVVIVAIRGFAISRSRRPLLAALRDGGYRVIVATTADDETRRLVDDGAIVEPIDFRRGGPNPAADIGAWLALRRIYRRHRPLLIHHFQAKPIILGGLAARGTDSIVVNTVTGLGHGFTTEGWLRRLASVGFRAALPRAAATVFQNPGDLDTLVDAGAITRDRTRLIASSGVDLTTFSPAATPPPGSTVLMAARLVGQKGVREYVEAARRLRTAHPGTRFMLAGETEHDHPDHIDQSWLDEAVAGGVIEYLGKVDDMPELLRRSTLVVLPTYHEGAPRILLEAAACAIPVVATDIPGCRVAVEDGVTGRLVPARNAGALALAIGELLGSPTTREAMGSAARRRVEDHFDIRSVTREYLELYRSLGASVPGR